MSAEADRLLHAPYATMPPATTRETACVTLRFGTMAPSAQAATAQTDLTPDDISQAESAMQAAGQPPTWLIPQGADQLDADLAARGYHSVGAKILMQAPAAALAARDIPYLSAFHAWPPMAIQSDIWSAGGVSQSRQAQFAASPSVNRSFLARTDDSPAGAGFAAIHDGIAMIYALEVLRPLRRKGAARHMITCIARWAQRSGTQYLGLAVDADNAPAIALYDSMGFTQMGGYHYRVLTT